MGLSQGKYGTLIKEGDRVLETMRVAMDKEMALVAAIRMKDVSALNNAITKAQSGDTTNVPASLSSAIRLRDELMGQASILVEIKVAVEAKNIAVLAELLLRAEQLNITNRYVDDAKILLDREEMRNQIYKQLVDAQDQQSLSEALEKAIQIGLNNEIVESARLRYDKMKDNTSAVEELKSATRNLDVIRVSENGLSEGDIAPLKIALSQMGSDDQVYGTLIKEAQENLARALKQLELQNILSGIHESTPIVEIKKSLRTSADAGLKNYIGAHLTCLDLMFFPQGLFMPLLSSRN
jgi:peptidyl-tRNA hydrolase